MKKLITILVLAAAAICANAERINITANIDGETVRFIGAITTNVVNGCHTCEIRNLRRIDAANRRTYSVTVTPVLSGEPCYSFAAETKDAATGNGEQFFFTTLGSGALHVDRHVRNYDAIVVSHGTGTYTIR